MGDPFRKNPILAPGEDDGRPHRKLVVASLVIHIVGLVVFVVFSAFFARSKEKEKPIDIVFYKAEDLRRAPPSEPEPIREPEPLPDPEPVEVAELPPPPEPEPSPAPPRPEPRVETPPPVARNVAPPKPAPDPVRPEPAKPERTVKTDAFAENRTPEPATAKRSRRAKTGGFASEKLTQPAPPGTQRAVALAAGGFEIEAPSAPAARTARQRTVVTGNGFTGDEPTYRTSSGRDRGAVQAGGFGSGGHVEDAGGGEPRRQRAVKTFDTPVEIVSKPRPVYTEKAKELRIEGSVVLEVTFGAGGRLSIHRVVESLGHGLDEAAVKAAEKIQFKPAQRDGRPVDHTATLRVVFRLA